MDEKVEKKWRGDKMKISLIFCLAVALILVACIFILFRYYEKLRKQYEALRESFRRVEHLNTELRAQRHDYLNHLQVVYGLMELEEYEELKKYLKPVFKDMMKTGKALKTSKPSINALLKAKMEEAQRQEVDFYVEVKSDLKGLQIEDWELCKVLSNLIDNALTAAAAHNEAVSEIEKGTEAAEPVAAEGGHEKSVRLEIMEDRENYIFSVTNSGPRIPEELREAIFRQGFTTKKEEGHGMGLYIVQNVLKNYKGTLELHSEEETTFTFRLPKAERR